MELEKGLVYMVKKEIELCINNIISRLYEESSSDIKKLLNKLQESKISPEQKDELLKLAVECSIGMGLMNNVEDSQYDELLKTSLQSAVNNIPTMQSAYIFKVTLTDHPEIYRVIKVPAVFSLGSLVYAILSSFRAEELHLFKVKYKNVDYYCSAYEDAQMYADDIALASLKLRKGVKMELNYDFGENYIFSIEYIGKEVHDKLLNEEDIEVIEGNGYGIIEDNHHLLNLYLDHPEGVEEYLKAIELEDVYFDINDFDTFTNTELVLDQFELIKSEYMNLIDISDGYTFEDDEEDVFDDIIN